MSKPLELRSSRRPPAESSSRREDSSRELASEPRDGDFRTLFEPHRREITLHCYRLLGSLQDAEEIAQESLLRAWQRRDERRPGGATRAWLYKIATNACLDLLRVRRRRRTLPHLLTPDAAAAASDDRAHDGLWIEPAPDSLLEPHDDIERSPDARTSLRESVGLAFITALQLLSPKQRAALLLVDVLGLSPHEAAELLETTVVSVSSLLQRARKNMESRPEESDPPSLVGNASLLRRYISTWESGDLDAFTALLAEDALLSMPPQSQWYAGRDAIRRFLQHVMSVAPRRYRLLPVAANGAAAVAVYSAPVDAGDYLPTAINVIAMRGGRITQMTRFALPELFPRFGLPARLHREAATSSA